MEITRHALREPFQTLPAVIGAAVILICQSPTAEHLQLHLDRVKAGKGIFPGSFYFTSLQFFLHTAGSKGALALHIAAVWLHECVG